MKRNSSMTNTLIANAIIMFLVMFCGIYSKASTAKEFYFTVKEGVNFEISTQLISDDLAPRSYQSSQEINSHQLLIGEIDYSQSHTEEVWLYHKNEEGSHMRNVKFFCNIKEATINDYVLITTDGKKFEHHHPTIYGMPNELVGKMNSIEKFNVQEEEAFNKACGTKRTAL